MSNNPVLVYRAISNGNGYSFTDTPFSFRNINDACDFLNNYGMGRYIFIRRETGLSMGVYSTYEHKFIC